MATHPAIAVADIEHRLGTRFTADTLAALTSRAPHTRFVWLMGADNLVSLPRWRDWTRIMETVPVAVIARPGYSLKARLSPAARRYAHAQLPKTMRGCCPAAHRPPGSSSRTGPPASPPHASARNADPETDEAPVRRSYRCGG